MFVYCRVFRVLKISEVYDYDKWAQIEDGIPDSGLFTEYINTFLKTKQQASGWPAGVVTEEQKQAYVDEYLEHEGVQLDSTKIEKNPGLRSLSKLCLNSFWVCLIFSTCCIVVVVMLFYMPLIS